jgi:hypothetical protein
MASIPGDEWHERIAEMSMQDDPRGDEDSPLKAELRALNEAAYDALFEAKLARNEPLRQRLLKLAHETDEIFETYA